MDTSRDAIYARVSSDRDGDELGVRRQIKLGRATSTQRGGTVVLELSDDDISALRGKHRPGYEALMAAVDAGQVDRIVVFQTSRLWRNRRERAEGIERLARAKVSVIAVKGPDLDMSTAYGRGMAGLIGEFDTLESEVKSERILVKVEELAQAGKIGNGGPRPFGYRRIYLGEGDRRKILRDELEPDEVEIVRECARRVLAGDSMHSVVIDLNSRGILTSTGRPWTKQALRSMLRGGRIAGLRERRRQIIGPAVWPAIITKEEHEQLRALLNSNQRAPGSRVRLHYLSGFVFGGCCVERNVRMKVSRQHNDLAYKCPSRSEGGCNGRVIRLLELEKMVDLYLTKRMSDKKLLRELAAREAAQDAEAAALVDQIEADERRLVVLKAALDDGDEDELPEVVASVRTVRARIAAGRQRLAARPGISALAAEDLPDLAKRWPDLELPRKRGLLSLFVERIVIGPGVAGRKFDPGRVDIVPRKLG